MSAGFGWNMTSDLIEKEAADVIFKGHKVGKIAALMRVLKETRNEVSLQLRELFPLDVYLYELALGRFWQLRNTVLAGESLFGNSATLGSQI